MSLRLHDPELGPLGPAERPFTGEQAVAVLRREGSLLLSANAGSGKTSVLAERFVRAVLEDEIGPAHLLAITFTDKAAGELRSRLRERLTELDRREAARDMEAAWVSTIHGFCARVLRAHAVAVGIDPAFTVLDDATARSIRTQAWDRSLAAFLAPPAAGGEVRPEALDLLAAYEPDRLSKALEEVHAELRSRGHTLPRLPPARPRSSVADAQVALRAAAAVLGPELAAAPGAGATLTAARDALVRCGELLDRGGPGADAVGELGFKRLGAALKTPACEAYREALERLAAAHVDAEAVAVHALLAELLAGYADRYAAGKRARSGLDYDDLQLAVRDLFDRDPAVATAYAERFERIMVDEFQDTNPLQLALLDHLDRGNVFLVGDELQSIYGFRHADVGVFRRRRAEHDRAGSGATLAVNWRSHPELLATINAAFADAHDNYVPLLPGRTDAHDGPPRTELLLVDAAWDANPDEADVDLELRGRVAADLPEEKPSRHAEARAVARRIRELIDGGCPPGEVAVLLRAATNLGLFERALELEGVPTLATGGRGFWMRQPVQDLCAYLGALANPRDGLAFYGLLASPLVGMTSDGLARLAAVSGAAGPWEYARERQGALGDVLAPGDRDRLLAAVRRLEAERPRAPRYGLDELIARAVAWSGYDLHLLRLPGGERRLANVHKLERLAAAFEADRGRDLRGLLDHAAAELEAEAREPDAPVDPGDRSTVALMTIHAAKGLEWDVVVLPDLGRLGNAGLPDILLGPDGDGGEAVGIRVVRMDEESVPALAYDALKDATRERAEQEDRRIVHVALTRARERLVLAGVAKVGEDWPRASAVAPPLAYIGARLDAALPHRLAAEDVVELDELRAHGRLRLRARRVAPETALQTLGLEGAEGQLSFRIDGGVAPSGTGGGGAGPGRRRGGAVAAPPDAGAAGPGAGVGAPGVPAVPGAGVGAPGVPAVPGAAAEPLPALSYSSLAAHARCGYRWYLDRVLRLPRKEEPPPDPEHPPTVDPEALEKRLRGSLVHAALERVDLGASGPSALPTDTELDALLAEAGAEDARITPAQAADARRLVATALAHPVLERLRRATVVRREAGFTFVMGELLFHGFVDVSAREPDGGALVVDWKTDRVWPDSDLEALVEQDYGVQRRIYALAELRAGAPRVEVVHLFLEAEGPSPTTTYTADDVPALEAFLLERAARLAAGDFPVAEHPHRELCGTCPGRGTLCSWPEERVLQPA